MSIDICKPTGKKLEELAVKTWPIWEKEPSSFDWHYDDREICYFLEGEVEVEFGREKVRIQKGDLVTFPQGLSCKWHIRKKVRKHYRFG